MGREMDSKRLKPWQARKIRERLQPALGYLTTLKRRMEQTAFLPTDPLYLATVTAHRALQDLLMDLHYLSCESGVGQPKDRDGGR